jgi:hypothetical protein
VRSRRRGIGAESNRAGLVHHRTERTDGHERPRVSATVQLSRHLSEVERLDEEAAAGIAPAAA